MTSKADLIHLEKMFDREIEAAVGGNPLDRLYQPRGSHVKDMAERGLCALETIEDPRGLSPVDGVSFRVTGWTLTELGRFVYCSECRDVEKTDAP